MRKAKLSISSFPSFLSYLSLNIEEESSVSIPISLPSLCSPPRHEAAPLIEVWSLGQSCKLLQWAETKNTGISVIFWAQEMCLASFQRLGGASAAWICQWVQVMWSSAQSTHSWYLGFQVNPSWCGRQPPSPQIKAY